MFYLKEKLLITVLLVIILGNLFDFLSDFSGGSGSIHLLEEAVVIVLSLALMCWLLFDIRRQQRELEQLRRELQERPVSVPQSTAASTTRRRLSSLIQGQFRDWELTASEQEVGILLLKGLTLKEIAALRQTGEKTVRGQASAIYRKAGVSGRHAFAAWFIEDFL